SLTDRQLRGPTNIPGNNTNPDQVHDVENVQPSQIVVPILVHARDLRVQPLQRFRASCLTTEGFDRRTLWPDLRVVEPWVRLTRLKERLEQHSDGLYPTFTGIRDDVGFLAHWLVELKPFVGTLKVEAYAYTEHRGFHEELERLSRIVPRHVPRADERAVLQRRRVLVLVHQRGSHDPQSTARRRPLEAEHPVERFLGGSLGFRVGPRKPVSLRVVLLQRVHSVDDSLAHLVPLLFGAVLLLTRVGTQERDLAKARSCGVGESPIRSNVLVFGHEVLVQLE